MFRLEVAGVFYKGPCAPGGPCSVFHPSYEFKDANSTEMTINSRISEVSEWSVSGTNAFIMLGTVVNSH